jgi:hypothetical protein
VLDDTVRCDFPLAAAFHLARRHDAHLPRLPRRVC